MTFIIIVVLASTVATTVHVGRSLSLASHSPISIVGNAGFNNITYPNNGVTRGNGSAIDPYIIEGWSIAASKTSDGIDVESANASFIIRNVYIYGPSPSNGIFLSNVANGVVDRSTVTSCYDGITILLSNATIENSVISSSGEHGVRILDSKNASILNNTVTQSMGDGIYSQSNNNTVISQNTISYNTRDGVEANSSTFVLLVLNNITSNGVGVKLSGSTNNLVHHNNFLTNSVQAMDNETGRNMWDVGYASGGNYWSDYTGADHCNGPAQNVCTRPDGIGDTPYTFASSTDRYPLMKLFVQTIIHDVAVANITPSATSVNQTKTLSITVTVTNEGAATENFTLTLYYDTTMIGSQTISALISGASQTLLFNWNTAGIALGAHTLKAVATTVWGEIDVADNTLVTGPVYVNAAPSIAPRSPTTTQPNPPIDSYVEAGGAILLLTFLAMIAYRRRNKTRRP
jgi:parallel beta-helix repeat protein